MTKASLDEDCILRFDKVVEWDVKDMCCWLKAVSRSRLDTLLSFRVFCHCYFAPGSNAKYCDECVCLSVCLSVRSHISKTTRPIHEIVSCTLGYISPVAMARSFSDGVAMC